jgi:glucokinase
MNNKFYLAGDVGGTKTRLSIFRTVDSSLIRENVSQYESSKYANLSDIINDFLSSHTDKIEGGKIEGGKIEGACFGIPGPVTDGKVDVTNLPWQLYDKEISKQISIPKVKLVNDLVATAASIPFLTENEIEVLHKGNPPKGDGVYVVIAPGTGMGQAILRQEGNNNFILASEGGHADFAPRNELECELLLYLKNKFGRVSVERVLCGPGLVNIYEFLRDNGHAKEPEELKKLMSQDTPASVISSTALDGRYEITNKALDMFIDMLGAHAGNVMLTVLGTKGVFLGGGVPPKILKKLKDGKIVKTYCDKGKLSKQVEIAPLSVIKDDHVALLGAASIASKL